MPMPTFAFNRFVFEIVPRKVKLNTSAEYRINFAATVHSALLYHPYRFESDKLLNPPNLVNPFYIVKLALKNRSFLRGDLNKSKYAGGPLFRSKL
jgi:hypothetical protein